VHYVLKRAARGRSLGLRTDGPATRHQTEEMHMNLIRWEPFKEADDFFRNFAPGMLGRWRLPAELQPKEFQWSPAADISETDKEYLVKAELPGVKREDVKVRLDNGVLTIEGERKLEKEDKNEKSHRVERFHGTFCRSFSLPEDADVAQVSADSKDGVLSVHIPKVKTETKPKSVEIKVQ
jgi:HSP20 family protein